MSNINPITTGSSTVSYVTKTFKGESESRFVASTVISSLDTLTVYADQVTGLNLNNPSTSATMTLPSGTTSISSSETTAISGSETQASSTSNGLSTGAKAGVGVGVGSGAVIVISLLILLLLRRRRNRQAPPENKPTRPRELEGAMPLEAGGEKARTPQELEGPALPRELEGALPPRELEGAQVSYELEATGYKDPPPKEK